MEHERRDWSESELFVRSMLEKHDAKLDRLAASLEHLALRLERKGVVWGAISGTVVSLLGAIISAVLRKHG